LHSLHPPVAHTVQQKMFGISSLAFDPVNDRLLASATNHKLYLYDMRGSPISDTPSQIYEGAKMNFYTKASFSPCGEFIASASTDSNVYLYETEPAISIDGDTCSYENFTHKPIHTLTCHQEETSSVDWSKRQVATLASTSDDARICIWRS
jgi:WD40 repeat protein